MADGQTSETFSENASIDLINSASEKYERGIALRKAGLFEQAVEEFEQAAASQSHALRAYAQIGLCHKSRGRYEDAVSAFRKALQSSRSSSKETVQILYVLGRTLETLGRIAETLEAYRWIRREDPAYRDVEQRIQQLSNQRRTGARSQSAQQSWIGGILRYWQVLLRSKATTKTLPSPSRR